MANVDVRGITTTRQFLVSIGVHSVRIVNLVKVHSAICAYSVQNVHSLKPAILGRSVSLQTDVRSVKPASLAGVVRSENNAHLLTNAAKILARRGNKSQTSV